MNKMQKSMTKIFPDEQDGAYEDTDAQSIYDTPDLADNGEDE